MSCLIRMWLWISGWHIPHCEGQRWMWHWEQCCSWTALQQGPAFCHVKWQTQKTKAAVGVFHRIVWASLMSESWQSSSHVTMIFKNGNISSILWQYLKHVVEAICLPSKVEVREAKYHWMLCRSVWALSGNLKLEAVCPPTVGLHSCCLHRILYI